MKLQEFLIEGNVRELHALVKNAEAEAFDNAAEDNRAVNGDDILKIVKAKLKNMVKGDISSQLKSAKQYIKTNYNK